MKRRVWKNGLCLMLAAAMTVSSVAAGTELSQAKKAAKKAVLKTKKVTLTKGKKKKIKITGKRAKAKYTFKSNSKVVKVNKKGVITAKKAGSAKVTVKEKYKKKTRKLGVVKVKVKKGSGSAQSPAVTATAPAVNAGSPSAAPTAKGNETNNPAGTGSPATDRPSGGNPSTTQPSGGNPSTDQPSSGNPSTDQPSTEEPAKETPEAGETALSLSNAKLGGEGGTLDYDASTGKLHAKDAAYFFIPLPEDLTPGTEVHITLTGKDNGTKGFRTWLALGESDVDLSEKKASTEDGIKGEFTWEFSLTSTDTVNQLEIKGITYQDRIDDLEVYGVSVTYKKNTAPVPTKVPMPTDLPKELVPARATEAPGTHAVAGLPLIYSDIPDVDYIRVGEDYYMVSTTMFLSPGVPIMHSKDLVHWEIVSYVYDTMEDNDTTNLTNGKQCYGKGSWAASLKYHDGTYYVCFSSNDQSKFYIYTTDDIRGRNWKKHSVSGLRHDPGLLFDDGKSYIVSGNGTITLQEFTLTEDGIDFKGTAQTIIERRPAGNIVNIEGSHIYHIGDYYYIFFIEWPNGGKRMQWCYRSKSLTGDWEGKVVFCSNGDAGAGGIAQGGIIDTIYGDWYAILFEDHGAVGRTPVLLDVYWVEDWPMMGTNGGKAGTSTSLDVNLTSAGENKVYGDDDFDYSENKLGLLWQWNHNPDNDNWSVTERQGYLRLRTGSTADSIMNARNSLTQRTVGPKCTSEVMLDTANMKDGDFTGICAFANKYGQVGVMKEDGKRYIYYGTATGSAEMEIKDAHKVELTQDNVYLRIAYNFSTSKASFQYSLDGTEWTGIGTSLAMAYDLTIFMGYRTYLYNYATKETGGYVDFDYYKITND